MKQAVALLLLAALLDAASSHGAEPTSRLLASAPAPARVEHPQADAEKRVEIHGARVRATEVLGIAAGTATAAADVDLGPAPPMGSSRLIERAEIERAFADASVPAPAKIPARIRVSRKTKHLGAPDVSQAVRHALGETKLARGAELVSVSALPAEVPAEFHHVTVDLGALPRKAGIVTIHAPFSFVDEAGAQLSRGLATIKLSLPAEAAFADIAKGSPIALVVKKGLLEVSVGAVAGTDADVGAVFPVTIKPSGRVVRARAVDKVHAVVMEDS